MVRTLLRSTHPDPEIERRGRTTILIGLVLLGIIALAIPFVIWRPDPVPSVAAMVMGVAAVLIGIWLVRRGQVGVAGWLLVLLSILVAGMPSIVRQETTSALFFLLFPIVIASLVLRSWQVWVITGLALGIIGLELLTTPADILARRVSSEVLGNAALITLGIGTISYIGARLVEQSFTRLSVAQAETQAAARALADANSGLETSVAERTAALRQALADVEARAAERQSLLEEISLQRETIREMSVPVLPVDAHTLVMPLVGALDTSRLLALQSQALGAIERSRVRTLLLDITGVPVVDTQVAQGLIQVIQATRLLGAEPLLIGVRPEVAQTLVSLGIDLAGVRTAASLESALRR